MREWLFAGAAALAVLAGWAAIAERRRYNRNDIDRVGWVNWPLVMVLALVGAMMLVMSAAGSG